MVHERERDSGNAQLLHGVLHKFFDLRDARGIERMGLTASKDFPLIPFGPDTPKYQIDRRRALLDCGLSAIENDNGPSCSRTQSQSFYHCAFIRGSFVIEHLALFPSFVRGTRSH